MKRLPCLLYVLIFLIACRSRGPSTATAPQQSEALPKGETEVTVFCTGPEYETDAGVFRAHSMGESMDMNVAKRKAMANARLELASSIETTVRGVTDSYVNSTAAGQDEQVETRYESLTREVVNQQLRGLRVICERYTRTPEGRYKAYVAVEMADRDLVNDYYRRLAEQQPSVNRDSVQTAFDRQMGKDTKATSDP